MYTLNDIEKRQPWNIAYVNIGQRCHNPNHPKYKFYGGRGIKRSLSTEDLKRMYYRDRADKMENPSVDRVDPNKDYSYDNCRYIEMAENRKLANDQRTARIKERKKQMNIEKLRDVVCKINRTGDMSEVTPKDIEQIFSPPFKGFKSRTKNYEYNPSLLGVRDGEKQRIRVSGSTRGGAHFGGTSGFYGSPTGGTYNT